MTTPQLPRSTTRLATEADVSTPPRLTGNSQPEAAAGSPGHPVHGPARANPNGHPCPPWCDIDHETADGGHRYIFHGSETAWTDVPVKPGRPDDRIYVRAIHGGYTDDQPQVDVSATRSGVCPSPHAWIAPRDAEGLAVIIEMLAKASPAKHRELAAHIRAAAATITGAQADPEAWAYQ
jgi:hypothetical protein